jgi:formylglycine-generating enzyme required for sulfatase activity
MEFSDRLEASLKARGFETLIDRAEIYAFEDWWGRIQALIGQSDAVVFVLSPDAVKSDVALKEVEYAASLHKRIAPIVCRRTEDAAVPETLRRLNFIFFDDPARFDDSANKLAEALQTDIVWIRDHTKFGEAARNWIGAGRPGGLLLRTPILEMAEYWMASRPHGAPALTEDVKEFVAASRKGAASAKRLRRVVLSSMFTLLIGIILGLVGWINQEYIGEQWRWWTVTRPYMISQVRPYVLPPSKERALKPGDSFNECKEDCPEMIVVPAGSFTMGAMTIESQAMGYATEIPQHAVTIARPFAVSKFELTFDEWDACVAHGNCLQGVSDGGWGRGKQPAIYVSWEDAKRYVEWIGIVTGKPYRLLSEAEFEYATRAGTKTVYPWGDEIGKNHANCKGCGSQWDYKQTAPVGSFAPNSFGLYDMVGNVWEWVEDCAHNNYGAAPLDGSAWIQNGDCNNRVVRSGSWYADESSVASADRYWTSTDHRSDNLGFRIARTLLAP